MIKTRKNVFRGDYKGQDLSNQDLSYTDFICCDFRNANLTSANCSYCNFTGSNLTDTICKDTDFGHSKLACIFKPRDAMGITLTLHCTTFTGMIISQLWWYGFLYCGMMMKPEFDEQKEKDPRDTIIGLMGADKYFRFKNLFRARQL